MRNALLDGRFMPAEVFRAVEAHYDGRARLVMDTGLFCVIGEHVWRVPSPELHVSSGQGRYMGIGLPQGVASAIHDPGVDTVVFCGDGGIGMFVSELKLAAAERLPLVVVLMSDGGFGTLRGRARKDSLTEQPLTVANPSWRAAVEGLGVPAVEAGSIDEILAALLGKGPGPLFIENAFSGGGVCEHARRSQVGRADRGMDKERFVPCLRRPEPSLRHLRPPGGDAPLRPVRTLLPGLHESGAGPGFLPRVLCPSVLGGQGKGRRRRGQPGKDSQADAVGAQAVPVRLEEPAPPESPWTESSKSAAPSGPIVRLLADELGAKPFGVEPSTALAALAGEKGGVELLADNVEALAALDLEEPMDMILNSHVLENIVDLGFVMDTYRRSLRDGGWLLIDTAQRLYPAVAGLRASLCLLRNVPSAPCWP